MKIKPLPLDKNYSYSFGQKCQERWEDIIEIFADANIYQTTAYNAARSGSQLVKKFILYKNNKIVAAAQVRIMKIPFINTKIAYTRWGPLWKLKGIENDIQDFRMAIRALRNEIVCKNGMILRILPMLFDTHDHFYSNILKNELYDLNKNEIRQRTLIVDLDNSLEKIRKNFNGKWRNLLNKAEKNELEIIEGTDDNMFNEFISIYKMMLDRKKFKEPHDINEFRDIQEKLDKRNKMMIFLCKNKNEIAAGGVFSGIGENGIYLLGATNDIGMKTKASYLIQWKAIQWMKECNCKTYNLNGINKELNYGVYHFKKGIAGKKSPEYRYCGAYDSYLGIKNKTLFNLSQKYELQIKNFIKKYLRK